MRRGVSVVRERPRTITERSRVSVVVTCYNYARFLPISVGSALRQVGVDVDVIIVDDASTDGSGALAAELASRDDRIRVIPLPVNQGPVAAFNQGLAAATGTYIVRLDADDALTGGSLRRSVALLEHHPSLGLVYGHPLHFTDDLPPARCAVQEWLVWRGRDWLEARCRAGTNVITSPEVVMRRAVLDRIGGMRPLAHTHDMELWLRIAAHADIGYLVGCDQAWHREHPASLSLQAEDPRIILADIDAAFQMLWDGAPHPDPQHVLAARRGVARQAAAQAQRFFDRGDVTECARDLTAMVARLDPQARGRGYGRRLLRSYRRARQNRTWSQVCGLGPRVWRRWMFQREQQRWHRTGCYEPIRPIQSERP